MSMYSNSPDLASRRRVSSWALPNDCPLSEVAWPASDSPRVYGCGSTRFIDAAADGLLELGYEADWIRTERFGATGS